jgi:hypothetical protein
MTLSSRTVKQFFLLCLVSSLCYAQHGEQFIPNDLFEKIRSSNLVLTGSVRSSDLVTPPLDPQLVKSIVENRPGASLPTKYGYMITIEIESSICMATDFDLKLASKTTGLPRGRVQVWLPMDLAKNHWHPWTFTALSGLRYALFLSLPTAEMTQQLEKEFPKLNGKTYYILNGERDGAYLIPLREIGTVEPQALADYKDAFKIRNISVAKRVERVTKTICAAIHLPGSGPEAKLVTLSRLSNSSDSDIASAAKAATNYFERLTGANYKD